MSEWKECELKSVAEVQTGPFGSQLKNEQYITGGTPVITVEHINNFRIIDFDYPSVTEEDKNRLSKYLLNEGDIVFTRVGSVDLSAYIKSHQNGWMFSSRMLRVRPNNNIDSRFLSYYFQQKRFRQYILNISVGATMPSINTEILETIPISYPPFSEQKAIAAVLSSLDDKIDLLHRQNKILEALAETLFRQWFVEEAQEGWEVEKLGLIAEVQNGYAFSSKNYVEYQQGYLEVLKMGHIERGGGLRTNPKRDYVPDEDKLKRWVLKKGDIVMAMTDMKDNVVILGVPAMVDKDNNYVLNQRVARIYLKNNEKLINNYLLYIQLKNLEFIANLQSKANSGVQVNLSTGTIKDCDIIVPPIEVQNEFGKTITNFYLKKEHNDNQIRTLEKLRDTLLPKLMSGEVRVKI